ncbi:hypothetical protein ACIHCQ_24040 [Streptomyces sp. NPDC052236]|uniref:hypothetical protein n=1 Tax=Streptomyces sp. NPDC052236 TaxID=3365686 RepID=UPI0037D0C922
MYAKRKVLWAASVAAVVMVVASGVSADAGGRVIAPEADMAHHGHASLTNGRLGVSLVTENLGPANLRNATVRLTLSVRPAGAQALPAGCLWSADQVIMCATGALRAGGTGRHFVLDLRTVGAPDEVVVNVATQWNGGAGDRNPRNNEHRVLTPATGDPYVF